MIRATALTRHGAETCHRARQGARVCGRGNLVRACPGPAAWSRGRPGTGHVRAPSRCHARWAGLPARASRSAGSCQQRAAGPVAPGIGRDKRRGAGLARVPERQPGRGARPVPASAAACGSSAGSGHPSPSCDASRTAQFGLRPRRGGAPGLCVRGVPRRRWAMSLRGATPGSSGAHGGRVPGREPPGRVSGVRRARCRRNSLAAALSSGPAVRNAPTPPAIGLPSPDRQPHRITRLRCTLNPGSGLPAGRPRSRPERVPGGPGGELSRAGRAAAVAPAPGGKPRAAAVTGRAA